MLEISVRRRMLWVGAAAFPLHNLSRVQAARYVPDRGAALLGLLKWLLGAVVAFAVLDLVFGGDTSAVKGNEGPLLVVLVLVVVFAGRALFEAATPILIVETAGGTWMVVTLPNADELRDIAGRIVHAIDHPEAEFTKNVYRFTQYNGPVVQQKGNGNTGMRL
ncbi:DUF6232 family protein [Streptomyces sp. NPDC059247]|uniref:DUF6232 family protein n=1 Tax=Streptomyces sp. NPDC059247 TaxID=3346790 RepID=UPI003673C099